MSDGIRAGSPLALRVLDVARSYIGVREHGKNRGPHVDLFLRSAGLDPNRGSYPWCCAFVVHVYQDAATGLALASPVPRTASCAKLWAKSPAAARTMTPAEGGIFVMLRPEGKGHTGIIESVFCDERGIGLVTIEGNTDASGSREGDGVYRRTRRPSECKGFLRFA